MADVDDMFALDSDPRVMRFLSRRVPTPRQTLEREVLPSLLAEYDRSPGFGVWAAVGNATGLFAGWFGLRITAGRDAGDAELGYRLRRAVCGLGQACAARGVTSG